MITHLNTSEIAVLKSTIGKSLTCFGGNYVSEHLIGPLVVMEFGDEVIEIFGKVQNLDMDGYAEEFSSIGVRLAPTANIKNAEIEGNLYFFNSGKTLNSITVVEETLTKKVDSASVWQITSDAALLFHFDNGEIAIFKMSIHDEALQVLHREVESQIYIPETTKYFEDDLETEYVTSRREFTLDQATTRDAD